jgi:hypothetical protein
LDAAIKKMSDDFRKVVSYKPDTPSSADQGDTPASEADLLAVRLTAQNRTIQIVRDAEALEAVAQFLRKSDTPGRIGMALLIERSAANLRQLVE